MNQNKLSIRFVISKVKMNQRGLCPISCRITFEKKRQAFATGLFVNPEYWNAKRQIVLDSDLESKFKKGQLSIIRQKLNNTFIELELTSNDYGINDIFDKYAGKIVRKEDNVVNYFRRFLVKKSHLVNKDIKEAT